MPAQTVRSIGMFQSAYSFGDVARALSATIPASQLNDHRTTNSTALTFMIGANIPRPVERFLVHRLLRLGAHPNAPDARHRTPLGQAAAAGHPALVRLLLDRGVPADAVPAGGRHVLFELCNANGEVDYPSNT